VASGTIVNAGGDYVDPGGISDNATVNGAGTQFVYGNADNTTECQWRHRFHRGRRE